MKTKLALVVALAAGLFTSVFAAQPSVVLELPRSAENPRNSEGDFIRLKDGRILFVYSHYEKGVGEDNDPACLASRVSADDGRTWSTNSVTVVPNEGGMNVMSVSLLRLDDGSIGLFYCRKNSTADCRPVLRVSTDEAKTWGPPRLCVSDAEKGYYVLNNCRVLRLKSGRLALPLSLHERVDGQSDGKGKLVCYLSDDGGKTWRRSRTAPFATVDDKGERVATQEPGLVELKDGRILMHARTDHGRQWFFYSSDGCETWTKGEPGTLFGPLGPATIRRLKNGDLLAIWNDHERHPECAKVGTDWSCGWRTPMTLAVSKDEGLSWPIRHDLFDDPNGWYCYFGVLELADRLLIGHCATDWLHQLQITEVPFDWLYAKDSAPLPPNVRPHENIEWSIGYGYHLADEKRALPRALLIGDSICNGYQGYVQERLEGKVNVSFWASSYCLTSPAYLKLLDIYLSESDHNVIHFNNGLHSLNSNPEAWEKGLRAAFDLIRAKRPGAKVIWGAITPLKDPKLTEKAKALNAIAAKVVGEYGYLTDDLFGLLDPLDREANWTDTFHHCDALKREEAEHIAQAILCELKALWRGEPVTACKEEGRYLGWPTVCRRASGEILAVFSGDRDGHVCPYGKVQMIRSTDEGRTWSAPETIASGKIDQRDAGILETKDGTLVVNWFSSIAYSWHQWRPEYHVYHAKLPAGTVERELGIWSIRSTDGGKTWTDKVRLPGQLPHNVTELADGRLLFVGKRYDLTFNPDDKEKPRPEQPLVVGVSEDGARTWREIARIPLAAGETTQGLDEAHAVQAPDGRIVCLIRAEVKGFKGIVQTESEDGGKTWTVPRRTPLRGFPPHLTVLSDGRLLATYSRRSYAGRGWDNGEYACFSKDGGRTWDVENEVLVAPAPSGDHGYPSTVQLASGWLLTVYYAPEKLGEKPCIRAVRW